MIVYAAIQARSQLSIDIAQQTFTYAIHQWESILQICARKGYSELGAIAHSEIGLILGHRYRIYGDDNDLHYATRLLTQYIHSVPDTYIEKPRICNGYGTIYRNLYEETGQIEYLNQAIATFEHFIGNTRLHPLHISVLHTGYANVLLFVLISLMISRMCFKPSLFKKALEACEPRSQRWVTTNAMLANSL